MVFLLRVVIGLALLALPLPALAHAILLDGTPAAGQTIPSGTLHVALRFNSRIDAARSRITLLHDGASRVLKIAAGATPDIVVSDIAIAPGAQVLRWQVLAVDGHITRGEIRFTAGAGQ